MDSLSATINKTVSAAVVSTVKSYVNEFASKLSKEINSKEGKKKEWKAEDFVSIWNTLAKDFVVKKGGKKEKSEPVDPECQCHHVYGKGDKKDTQCEDKISEKSTTKKYCVRHYKQQEKDKKPKKDGEECSGECNYILTKGENEGTECGVKVSAKSKSGKYCSKHLGEEKKEKKINKTELLKCIREQTKDVDEEDEDALKESFSEVEKKFGYMAIYNMETLAPKMYEKFQTVIDSLIEDGREDNEDAIKEAEVEAEEAEKEKAKKEAKAKKESKKSKKSDDEEEEKSGSDKKKSGSDKKSEKSGSDKKSEKSGSDKKSEKSGSDKKKAEKSGSDKKAEKSAYEDGSSLAAASPRVKDSKKSKTLEEEEEVEEPEADEEEEEVEEPEADEEEEEVVKISAKRFKSGDLKDQVYFIDGKTNTTFLLNTKERTVSHKIVDGKKVALNSGDKARLVKYDLTPA